jgi:hypothetical protein
MSDRGKRLQYTLSDEELAVLEDAINHAPEPEVRQRAIAIRLLHLGQTPEQAGQAGQWTISSPVFTHNRSCVDSPAASVEKLQKGAPTFGSPPTVV